MPQPNVGRRLCLWITVAAVLLSAVAVGAQPVSVTSGGLDMKPSSAR